MTRGKSSAALRTTEIAQAGAIYADGVAAGHGGIVFIGGPPASGRSALLGSIASAMKDLRPRAQVLHGRIADGEYAPIDPRPAKFADAAATVEGGLGLAGAALPLLGLIAQASATSRAAARVVKGNRPAAPGDLQRTLRAAATDGPVICLVDDCDELDGRWWSGMLLGLANEIATSLPLFLFLTVERNGDLGPHHDSASDALYTARALTGSRSLARWWSLAPVDADGLAGLTGDATPDVRRALHNLTEGRASWAASTWNDWRGSGVVERDTDLGPWRFAPGQPQLSPASLGQALRDRVAERLGGDLDRIEQARRILGCAALEGRLFTADAVATALGWDADDLIDFLDDHLCPTDEHEGIVDEAGFVSPAGAPGSLCRYSFASPLLRSAFQDYVLDAAERVALAGALARALDDAYAFESERVAGKISRLLAIGGDLEGATSFREAANSRMSDQALVDQARTLLTTDLGELSWTEAHHTTEVLLDGSSALSRIGPVDEAAAMAGRAAAVARRVGNVPDEARALMSQGADESGAAAHSHLDAALALFDAAGIAAGKAHTLYLLGWHELNHHEGDRVFDLADEALAIWHRLGHTEGQLNIAILRASAVLDRGRPVAEVKQAVADALALEPYADVYERGRIHGIAARSAFADHDFRIAATHFRIAVDAFQEAGHLRMAADSTLSLGTALADANDPTALAVLRDAATMAAALDEHEDEAIARQLIGRRLGEDGHTEAAIEELNRAVALHRVLDAEYAAILGMVDIGNTLATAGDRDRARAAYAAAEAAAESAALPDLLIQVVLATATLAINGDDFGEAEQTLNRALALQRDVGDPADEAKVLGWLAKAKWALGDHDGARGCVDEAIRIAAEIDDETLRADSEEIRQGIDSFEASGERFGVGGSWRIEIRPTVM
jgi:tetratricopeptide (TPR) repeat protein